jgi:four helix bundle protein
MKIEKFEDIEAWKEARKLNSQIQRASISVMANIAEGFDRQSEKEFVQYLSIASSSASEIQSHLYAALDLGYIKEEEFRHFYEQTRTVKKLINGFIAYLKRRK